MGDFKRDAAQRLREYNMRLTAIDNLRHQLASLAAEQTAIRSVATDSEPVSGSPGSRREDAMIGAIMRKDMLQTSMRIAEHEIAVTRRGLAALTKDERQVLSMFYIERKNYEVICAEMHFEKTKFYKTRDAALRRFTMACYGVVDI